MLKMKGVFVLFFFCVVIEGIYAQQTDTLRLTIAQAEQIFLKKNMELLAAKYNVDAQRALVIQAKIYPNPNLSAAAGIYDPNNHKYFDITNPYGGELSGQLSQLILIAGKRKKQIEMAETNTQLAEDAFADLLRNLKYTLRTDFISIYYWQQTAKVYDEEIDGLKRIAAADILQQDKGFIAKTQTVRDQAQLYSLQSEYNDLKNQINDKESEVRYFIDSPGNGSYIIPLLDTAQILNNNPLKYPLAALIDSATKNRTDLMTARDNFTLSKQNLSYQKALGVPDVTLSLDYDENGSYWHNFNALGISFDLPVFNRNQGNIKSAKFAIKSNEATLGATNHQVEENVFRALQLAIDQRKLYDGIDKNFPDQFEKLAKEVLNQYLKRNMSMLDFLNFYDAYKTNTVQINSILSDLANAYANIDFMTGTDFFIK